MPQPTPYVPSVNFSNEEATNVGGRSTVRTAPLDAELANIETTLRGVLANLALNQRDDGEIRDQRVKLPSLSQDVRALLTAGNVTEANLRGAWVTATAYFRLDMVSQGGNTYICAIAHTGGTFATDLAAGRWLLVALGAATAASAVPFTPTATIAASNVQAAVEESDTENRALSAAVQTALTAFISSLAAIGGAGLVGYGSGTTGAVLRTSLAKMRDTYSPLEVGAVGDGTTDDSAAIQTAANSGRVVDLLGKTYRVVSKITFSTSSTHFCNGRLLFAGANTTRLADITAGNVTFEDVIFDGNNLQPRYSLVYVTADVLRPKFKRCSFRNLYGTATGTTLVNQMYALNVNPYGVVGFEVEGCEFRNLRKLNDGSIVPATVGFGFVGGVCFNTEDGSDPAAAQPTPSQGIISNCQFDTVKTILATGLSDNDVSQFDDGDGIRTIQGAGALRLYVDVTGCTFRNVSKRAVKLRASGGNFSDSTVIASLGAYGMSTPIDLVNGCWADNIRLITSAALPVLKVATLANSGDTTNLPLSFGVRGITCGHAKVGVELTSAGAVPMAGMVVQDVKIGACSDRGFLTTGTAPSTQSNMVIDDFQIVGSGNNCAAIRASAAADSTGGWFISGVVTQNADVKVEGTNNVLRGSRFRFTSTAYAGFNATGALVEFGSGKGLGGESVVEDVTIDAAGINTSYLSATRPYLALFSSDSMTIKGLKIVAPDGLSNSYPAFEGVGDDVVIDGFDYFGSSFCRHGSLVASSRWAVKNAVRRGNGACSVPFWSLAAAAQFYEFSNITDFRPTTQPTINSSTATNGIASVVNTRSSHVSGGVAGVAKTAAVNTF